MKLYLKCSFANWSFAYSLTFFSQYSLKRFDILVILRAAQLQFTDVNQEPSPVVTLLQPNHIFTTKPLEVFLSSPLNFNLNLSISHQAVNSQATKTISHSLKTLTFSFFEYSSSMSYLDTSLKPLTSLYCCSKLKASCSYLVHL